MISRHILTEIPQGTVLVPTPSKTQQFADYTALNFDIRVIHVNIHRNVTFHKTEHWVIKIRMNCRDDGDGARWNMLKW
jgi:hypothetical protein